MADGFPAGNSVRADVLSDVQARMLNDNLDPKHVKGRKQGGTNVNYIEGWHAIKEANRIFGFGGWDPHRDAGEFASWIMDEFERDEAPWGDDNYTWTAGDARELVDEFAEDR